MVSEKNCQLYNKKVYLFFPTSHLGIDLGDKKEGPLPASGLPENIRQHGTKQNMISLRGRSKTRDQLPLEQIVVAPRY